MSGTERIGGPAGPVEDRSEFEERMAQLVPSFSEALIQRLLEILTTGRRSATYKPALVLALVELSIERAPIDDASLTLPLNDVAERVLELYWPASRPYRGGVLRQATMPNSRIGRAVLELRDAVGGSGGGSLSHARMRNPEAVRAAVAAVADALARQPVPRLQRPGEAAAGVDYVRFLYDDSRYRTEQGALDRDPVVTLPPGVARALARNASVIRLTAQAVWVNELVAINRLPTEEVHLRQFLFGADRVSMRQVAPGLADLQSGRCFYCDRGLPRDFDVDHVVPWSANPNDDLFNLVAADPSCNSGKRDRLLVGGRLEAWTARDRVRLADIAASSEWPMDPQRTAAVARSAYLSLAEGIPAWRGPGDVIPFGRIERAQALGALDSLDDSLAGPVS